MSKLDQGDEIEMREVFFYRRFEVGLDPNNKDLTAIAAGKHTLVFPIEMAEALAIHILRVTQLQRECAATGDYSKLQHRVTAIQFNADEIERQSKAYDRAKAAGDLHEN